MNACYSVWNTEYIRTRYANYSHSQVEWRKWSFKDKENFIYIYIHILDSFFETSSLLLFLFLFLFSLFSMWTRGKEIVCVKKEKKLTFLFGTLDSAQPVVFSAGNSIDVRYRLQLRKLMLPRWLKIVIVSPLCILRVWHARLHLAGPNYILFSFRL